MQKKGGGEHMIRFNADHHFHIGRAHDAGGKPCQDYALSAHDMQAAYAIIADGCSSGGRTDIGARIITLAAAQALMRHAASRAETERARGKIMQNAARALHLETDDMLATCVYAHLATNGGYINVIGDGAFALKYRSGAMLLVRFSWNNNMPAYAAYAADGFAAFIAAHGNDIHARVLRREEYEYCPGLGFVRADDDMLPLGEGIRGIAFPVAEMQIRDRLECVAVFSDGIDQVENMDWKEAIVRLLSFKNTAGEFAKRRMIRFIKESREIGKGPLDDIAYAVIQIARDEGKEESDDADKKPDMDQP